MTKEKTVREKGLGNRETGRKERGDGKRDIGEKQRVRVKGRDQGMKRGGNGEHGIREGEWRGRGERANGEGEKERGRMEKE